jgi:release factor glutamine methyltransferase
MENQTIEPTDAQARRISPVVQQAARRLLSAGIDTGFLDAEVLLCHVLGATREQIVLAASAPLSDSELRAYEALLSRRLAREPTAYITGMREFWSLDFHVAPDVLIPRPETELLVETALRLALELGSNQLLRIVDVGTGSGAIAVALASELADAEIFAIDLSAAALAVAKGNALRNHVAGKIKFVQGDLLAALQVNQQIDLIVSNPPYIRRADIDALEPEVRRWEPRSALDGGWDGLHYYRRIAPEAFHYLRPNGAVVVEIGAGMGEAVAALFKDIAGSAEVKIHHDYAGNERVVAARKIARA